MKENNDGKNDNDVEEEEYVFKTLFTMYSDLISTHYSDKFILVSFGQKPQDDDGKIPSCRVYFDRENLENVIEILKDTLETFDKKKEEKDSSE